MMELIWDSDDELVLARIMDEAEASISQLYSAENHATFHGTFGRLLLFGRQSGRSRDPFLTKHSDVHLCSLFRLASVKIGRFV